MYFENRLRVRVCGILRCTDDFLLIDHQKLTPSNHFWTFPGGEVKYKESFTQALKREFFEETNLIIEVGRLFSVAEIILPTRHAVQLYFLVENTKILSLKKGYDPEDLNNQIIQEIGFLNPKTIENIPQSEKDPIFHYWDSETFLNNAPSHFKFENHEIKMH